jgi:CBS domain-containing protein
LEAAVKARDLMTSEVVSVSPDTPLRDIAGLLLAHQISAVPVVDAAGTVVGMVSEGDLIGRSEAEREARRDWWLALLAEGQALSADFLAALRDAERTARDVMSAPVVRVTEDTEASEIAALLAQYRIKRVPVVRNGKVVGIISRADLLRALADAEAPGRTAPEHVARTRSLLAEALASLDHHFFGERGQRQTASPLAPDQATARGGLSVADFRSLAAGFEHHKAELADAARRADDERRSKKIKELIDEHVRGGDWNALLHRAREAAERGEKEFQLLRVPSNLCSDQGRAINSALTDWPQTLRGKAAEIYLRWERELKPRGFHLAARVLDFPHGMPGDIGLFLVWGE